MNFGKILNKKQIPMLFFTAVCLLIAVPIRTLLLLNNTEHPSGFYRENNILVWVLYGIAALALVVPLLYNMRMPKRITPFGKSRSRAISFTGIALAIAMLYDFINQTVAFVNSFAEMGGGTGLAGFYADGGVPMVLQLVCAIVGAFYILIYAFSFFGGTLNYRNFKMIALFPALWLACRLIRHFLVEVNYLFVSQRLLEMLMLILAIVFFFNLAKLNACFEDGVRNWKLFGCGWGCVFLCAVLTVPRLLVLMMGKGASLPGIETSEFVDLVMGAFVFMYLLKGSVVSLKRKPAEKKKASRAN